MARFTKGKGWRVIAFLRVPVAMNVAMDILPLEKILGGVSKCPRNICAETAVQEQLCDLLGHFPLLIQIQLM